VHIGANTLIGPAVQIYTAMHPMNWEERILGPEFAKPVIIGSNVWIGGGAIICPGVHIGGRCVIGAGSVVTRDIPDDVFAAGNPCRVIKQLKKI
jgi:maltose O-acetyltransferase